jgi:hypothetical protein
MNGKQGEQTKVKPKTSPQQTAARLPAGNEWQIDQQPSGDLLTVASSLRNLPDLPTTQRLRQQGVVQMQRQLGNSYVQRILRDATPTEVESDNELSNGRNGGGLAFAPPAPPPAPPGNNGRPNGNGFYRASGQIQRQEEGEESGPSEAEKAAALAAAQAAEAAANAAASQGEQEVVKSQADTTKEQTAGQAAQQETSQVKAATKPVKKEEGGGVKKAPKRAPKQGSMGGATAVNGQVIPGQAPTSPEADPGFQKMKAKAKLVGQKEKRHAPAQVESQKAQEAAESPASELEGQAGASQVSGMEQAETPGFNAAAFKAQLMQRIESLAPRTAKEADDFKGSNKLGGVKGEMTSKAKQEQESSKTPMEQATKAAPDASAATPKPVTPLAVIERGEAPGDIGTAAAAPKEKGQVEVEAPIHENAQGPDKEMAEADITEEQLANSNEPEFQVALDAKSEAKTHAQEGPEAYRAQEQQQIEQAKGEAGMTAGQGLQEMHGGRDALLSQVEGQQGQTKSEDEKAREEVGNQIQAIYSQTKERVEQILSKLDGDVERLFDAGAAAAKQAFENYVDAKMKAYKERRYGGWLGWAKWAKDKLAGMPGEVNTFYQQGRQLYLRKMDAVIDSVVSLIGRTLTEAKVEVAKGKQKINDYVNTLPDNLREVGQQAAQDIEAKFTELEQTVDSKQDALIETLANKYQENLQAIDARIEELKAANQGLVDKAINAVKGVIDTILKLKDMLLSILAQAADAIGKIIKNPIGFLGNLISGVKQGLSNFVANIGTHIKKGLMSWLFGELAGAGIQLPEKFDLKGILTLVMQVLGLTWENLRARAVKMFGENVVAGLEKTFEIFMIVKEKGIGGLWEFIKDKLSSLKDTVIEGIKDMVITQVIQAGVQWLIGILGGPAGAFVKAAKAIYDIIIWFVNNGSRLIALVQAIISSVSAIASGAVGMAAKFIEDALAKAIPVVIGFLASLLGLGNLSQKIKGIIEKVQAPINKAIDWVLGKAKAAVKKLAGMFKRDKNAKDQMKFTDNDRKKALTAVETEEKKYVKDSSVSQADAKKVALSVKQKHPVVESLTVIDGKDSWDYQYVLRKKSGVKDTPPQKAAGFSAELGNTDPHARADIEAVIEKKKRSLGGKSWEEAKALVQKDAQFKPVYTTPLLKSHTFGSHAHEQAVRALQTATQRLKKEDKVGNYEVSVNSRKQFIHSGEAGYGTKALNKLQEQIFDKNKKSAATQALRETFEFILENDSSTPVHQEYKPENLRIRKQGAKQIVTYTTPAGGKFEAVIGADGFTESVKGTSLSRKTPGTRGVTERSPGYEANMSMNSSHLIGDIFTGSGYRASANLISASAHFNQKVMGSVERTIDRFIDQIGEKHGLTGLEMTVNVKWGKLDDAKVKSKLEREVKRQGIKINVDDANAKLKAANPSLQRCMNVEYIVKVKDGKGKSYSLTPIPNTGPDLWFGSE